MRIGIPRETKKFEYRVGLTTAQVKTLVDSGHQLAVEHDCGIAIGFSSQDYNNAGATIVNNAKAVFDNADMIVKVKEPQPEECKLLRKGQILFTFLHLAADRALTQALLDTGVIAIAYETVTDSNGRLPILATMSAIAGKLSAQQGAFYLEKHHGGNGILLGGVGDIPPANVCVIGGGVAGQNAATVALGMGAKVTILERSQQQLTRLKKKFGTQIELCQSNERNIRDNLKQADVMIGAVLIPGSKAPKLVSRRQLTLMKPGSVLVDISIDQGGCFETSRATDFENPTYVIDNITHFCVANLPSAAARTATLALSSAMFPYVQALAEKSDSALIEDQALESGTNIYRGLLTNKQVADALNLPYSKLIDIAGN